MKKTISVLLCVVTLVLALCACGGDSEIVGKWTANPYGEEVAIEFDSDNEVKAYQIASKDMLFTGQWEYDGDVLTMDVVDADSGITTYYFTGKLVSGKLVLSMDGESLTFTKK